MGEPPAPEEEASAEGNCGLSSYNVIADYTIKGKKAKRSKKGDVRGLSADDTACICAEMCESEYDYWSVVSSRKNRGKCMCFGGLKKAKMVRMKQKQKKK